MKKLALVIALFMCSTQVNAKGESWEYQRASHIAMGESISSFFSDLGSNADVGMQISEQVRERRDLVTVTYTDKKIVDILNDMTSAYGMLWYWDGQTLYIYNADELQERKVELYDGGAPELIQSLKTYGFYDGRYDLRSNRTGNVVFFSAPPRYAQLITQVAEEVNRDLAKSGSKDSTLRFKQFQLKYATAYDREVSYGGASKTIEGVATLLNRAVSGSPEGQRRRIPQTASSDKDNTLSNYGKSAKDEQKYVGEVIRLEDRNNFTKQLKQPSITADTQTNSVIVYDTLENISIYENFILKLDQPTEQIEISVSIIDVQSDDLNEIGINWAGNGTDFDIGFGSAAAIEQTNAASSYIGFGNYQNTTTLLASQVKTLMGNIQVINNNSGAKILSKPAVVTQDNLEAIIDHVSTFYVRLQGREEVELVPIQSGSVLRVIPRVIGKVGANPMETEIQMEVSIQDGATSSTNQVDNIPIVNSSTIKTQAIVTNGESLLVGGFYYDSEEDDVRKVPFLGDIPVLGSLFKHTKTRKTQLSRLFLITPRLVGKKLNAMEKLKISDGIDDVTRSNRKDYIFNGMILD